MIDISTALQNILKAVYGRDVRESIHDAIYQINANANEAIDLAQIKFGTAVNSPTDPIAGFTENSVYLNVNTGIMWRLEGGSWVKKGTFKSIDSISLSGTSGLIDTYTITFTDGSTSNYTVKNGADGKSITGITKTSTSGNVDHYDVDLSDGSTISGFDVTNGTNGADGSDGKSIANISLASTSGNVKTYDVILDDGTKTPTGFSIEDGASSYLHIRYSSSFDGTGMVTTPTDATVYIGILVSTSSVAPTNPSLYSWVRFIGKSGTGSGDMLSADYATKYPNTVDKAAALYDGTDEILANQLMKKSQYDADDDGVVDNAEHATNADNVGNANTSLLEKLSDNSGKLNYNGNALMLEAAQFANQAKLGEFVVNQIGNNVKELALHSNITTKLSKVDTPDNLSVELAKKIDKPASATNGQVLTYNGTSNEWEAQDSKGGGSGTARVNVSGIPSGYSLYYYDVSDPSTKNPVSGTSVEVGFGTYRFYASNGSDNTSETEVIVDTLKIYNITLKVIYAVHISMSEADPDSAVTFPSGYDNSDFSDNAYMDLSGGSFHYGDWVNAFFMPKSCMLKFDGTVDYYLNEDDETKKEDGTPSDVANINYGGNAMVEWGKIYFGFKGDADGNGYTFIVSDSPSEGLDCYCNIDANKNEIDHFYTPKYFGSNDSSNRLRSISGQSNYVKQTGTTELSHAKANGNGWSTECYGDWTLIKHLLVLMSKSLNIQAKYGYGRCSTSNSTAIGQGTMNGKGRFWGDNSQTNGVKIFGMENWYGNLWRRIEGYVTNSSGVQLVKMCYGTRDGSTADAYSTDGTGYVSMGTTSGTSGSGIQTMHVNNKCGVVPKALTGNTSPTTYFSDGYWYNNSCYALIGGSWGDGLRVGAFYSYIAYAVSEALASFGAAVSCKPLSA